MKPVEGLEREPGYLICRPPKLQWLGKALAALLWERGPFSCQRRGCCRLSGRKCSSSQQRWGARGLVWVLRVQGKGRGRLGWGAEEGRHPGLSKELGVSPDGAPTAAPGKACRARRGLCAGSWLLLPTPNKSHGEGSAHPDQHRHINKTYVGPLIQINI